MKRTTLYAAVLAVVCLLFTASIYAQRGGRGGMRGGRPSGGVPPEMMAQMQALKAFPLERQWTALSFACELSDSQLVMLRSVIADAYAKRLGVLKAAKKGGSWEDAKEVLDNLKEDVDDRLEVVLTKDQRKKLKKAIENSNFEPKSRMR